MRFGKLRGAYERLINPPHVSEAHVIRLRELLLALRVPASRPDPLPGPYLTESLLIGPKKGLWISYPRRFKGSDLMSEEVAGG